MGNLAERIGSAPPKPAPTGGRGAGRRAAAFLAIALVAASGAGLLFKRYMERSRRTEALPLSKVVVAGEPVPAGTVLRAQLLRSVEWPRDRLPEGASDEVAKLVGQVTLVPLAKGEAVLLSHLASREAGQGLAALLPASMRALAVRVDDVVGVAGFIHPGDHVDVVVTMKPNEDPDVPPVSKVILQDVPVLAVGRQSDRDEKTLAKAVPVTVATLEVSSPDAEKLALATTKGQILLALRSRTDEVDVRTLGIDPEALLGEHWRRVEPKPVVATRAHAPRRRAPTVTPVAAPPAPQNEEVEILRGDRFETRKFKASGSKP